MLANQLDMPNDEQYSQPDKVGKEQHKECRGAETVELAN